MKTQATRCSQTQLYWRKYWAEQGYDVSKLETVPENRYTPPDNFATKHPLLDATISLVLGILIFAALYLAH